MTLPVLTAAQDLHEALVARQSTAELTRKASKARRRDIFTREELDAASRRADEIVEVVKWD